MSALAGVVRHAINACLTDGVWVPADLEGGCALVETWLAGGAGVDDAALAAARDRAHKESERANKQDAAIGGSPQWKERDGERLSLRRTAWLGSAVGNLCQTALKEPGWHKTAPVMDAATYALPGGTQSLEELRLRLLAQGSSSPQPSPIGRRKKPRGLPLHDVVARVGAPLAKHLKRIHARIDPDARAEVTALRRLLEAKGYRASAAVLAFDAVYGGLTVLDDDDLPVLFGAYSCLKSGAHDAPRGGRSDLVPVVYAPSDVIYFLDDNGGAWAQDTIEDQAAAPSARSGDALVVHVLTMLRKS